MAQRSLVVALSLAGKPCLVIGSGDEAELRVENLLECGARVTLLAPVLPALLEPRCASGELTWHGRAFEEDDLDAQWLAVQCDRNAELARRIAAAAEARGVFFCAIDQPEFGSFAHLAQVKSADLTIAISTGGRVPGLAGHLRRELQSVLDRARFRDFFEWLAELRARTPAEARKQVLGEALSQVRFSGQLELPEPFDRER